MLETFLVFLRLGLTAFGGPVAHIGYFREEFVARRKWLGDAAYADLVALCQFLPGPASSQVGLGIGMMRGGFAGALAAWTGFTLPSAVLMGAAAIWLVQFGDALPPGLLAGLKAVVVAVVAHALLGMGRSLCPDATRATMAAAAAIATLMIAGATGQLLVIAAGAVIGLAVIRPDAPSAEGDDGFHAKVGKTAAIICLALFVALLAGLPFLAASQPSLTTEVADGFYRSGALVFGGGHVVLPLLQAEVVPTGLVGAQDFTAGYGLAQAVPGPLFTFSAFLGGAAGLDATGSQTAAVAFAALALVMIFLPGALLVAAALPFWASLRANPTARRALAGVNAAVVGILAAALYDPVWLTAIRGVTDLSIAIAAFALLAFWRVPAWAVVLLGAALGVIAAQAGLPA